MARQSRREIAKVSMTARTKLPLLGRLAPVVGLFFLAPIAAEYLSGYHGQVLRPDVLLGLLFSLLLLGPLYGAPAVLIREFARRAGRGWPTILLLSAAFGLVQAGLIDQTLFNHASFSDGPYWQTLPTLIPGVDVDASQLLVFVGGHMICSFAAPIAVVEACVPRRADQPWLGRIGIAVMVVLYLLAAATIFGGVADKIGPVQFFSTALVVLALAAIAFAIPRRHASRRGRVPPAWLVGGTTLVLLAAHVLAREPEPGAWSWPSVALAVLVLALLGGLLLFWSGRTGWTRTHVLAVAGVPLLIYTALAFAVPPVDNVGDYASKYLSNALFLAAVLALLAFAYHRLRRTENVIGAEGGLPRTKDDSSGGGDGVPPPGG